MAELIVHSDFDFHLLISYGHTVCMNTGFRFTQNCFGLLKILKRELAHLFFSQYILSDRISYPDETFMDMEFKISVMYDIAKVLFL